MVTSTLLGKHAPPKQASVEAEARKAAGELAEVQGTCSALHAALAGECVFTLFPCQTAVLQYHFQTILFSILV